MTALVFNFHSKELPVVVNVGDVRSAVADILLKRGFTDVVHTQSEVAGNRSGVRVSVLHLRISDRSFWEVVMAAGDAANATQGALNEVVDAISKLTVRGETGGPNLE